MGHVYAEVELVNGDDLVVVLPLQEELVTNPAHPDFPIWNMKPMKSEPVAP